MQNIYAFCSLLAWLSPHVGLRVIVTVGDYSFGDSHIGYAIGVNAPNIIRIVRLQ